MSKVPNVSGKANPYWGRSIRCRIGSEFVTDKVLASNYEKLLSMGLPYAVWREASSVVLNTIQCSCFKTSSKQADIPCASCYGTGNIPGYLKWGTQNYWAESTAPGWTLTNLVLDKVNRPFRFMLSPAALTGTAISAAIPINVAAKIGPWESKSDGFTRDGGVASSITVEVSKDTGATWFPLSALEAQAPTITIMFRVTLTRTATTVKSPMFEIVRTRFQTIADIVDVTTGGIAEPVIRVIPTTDTETEIRQAFGSKMEQEGKRFWTMPLNFFDTTLPKDVFAARLADDVFVEVRYGGQIGFRYSLTQFVYSDSFSVFSHQSFSLRRLAGSPGKLQGEVFYRVF